MAPTTTIRPLKSAGSSLPGNEVGEGDGRERARPAPVVDEGLAVREAPRVDAPVADLLRRRDGDRLQMGDRVGKAGHDRATVVGEVRGGRAGIDCSESVVAAQHAGVAAIFDLAGREHRSAGAADRVVQREILARLRRLGELDVVDDRARARGVQRIDGAACSERGTAIAVQVGERPVVDRDDRDVGRLRRGAQREPQRHAVALEPGKGAGELGASPRPAAACRPQGPASDWPDARPRAPRLAAAREVLVPARDGTERWRRTSRTRTFPAVTRVSVPSQRSIVSQRVPRTVATLFLPCVR